MKVVIPDPEPPKPPQQPDTDVIESLQAEALDELTRQAEDLGLYDEDPTVVMPWPEAPMVRRKDDDPTDVIEALVAERDGLRVEVERLQRNLVLLTSTSVIDPVLGPGHSLEEPEPPSLPPTLRAAINRLAVEDGTEPDEWILERLTAAVEGRLVIPDKPEQSAGSVQPMPDPYKQGKKAKQAEHPSVSAPPGGWSRPGAPPKMVKPWLKSGTGKGSNEKTQGEVSE